MNAECTLVYDLPKGHSYVRFSALCGYDSSCERDNPSTSGTTMEFMLSLVQSTTTVIDFDLTQLGYGVDEDVPLYDIWAKKHVGTARGTLSTEVPKHGVRLFRLGNKVADGIEHMKNDLTGDAASGAITTLQGMRLNVSAASLPEGLYIIGGRKVLVP